MSRPAVEKVFHFPSRSNPGKEYETVRYQDGSLSCNCPEWTGRASADGSRSCRHTRSVLRGEAAGHHIHGSDSWDPTSRRRPVANAAGREETTRHLFWWGDKSLTAVIAEFASSAERRSCTVFATVLLLALLAVFFPEMPPQALQGILWAGVGVLMLLLPPEVRVPRAWRWLAAGFMCFSVAGFLPKEWFHVSAWRLDLEALGLDTGPFAFVQPRLALETWVGFAVTAAVVLFLLGHRVGSRLHYGLALGFALGVWAWALAAVCCQPLGGMFGFFPNRNHTATLLAMGTFAGLGCFAETIHRHVEQLRAMGFTGRDRFAQAIRLKEPWKIVLSVIPACLCLWVLLTISESRAGVVLAAAGFVAWILLTGFRHLRGHAGIAVVVVLIVACGVFLSVDSKVKTRLEKTVEVLKASAPIAVAPRITFNEGTAIQPELSMDMRIAVFRDTWTMIRREPWTGVGPRQFAQVFPQYEKIANVGDAKCLHPENDWLQMLSETGWPAFLCIVGGMTAVFLTALNRARRGPDRFLCMGSLVAALLLCLHGVFDVPGHRVGLAWSAALLLAVSLRPPEEEGPHASSGSLLAPRLGWRCLGVILLLMGGGLLVAQWINVPILPSVQVLRHMEKVKALYETDRAAYDRATAAGRQYQPPPDQDPLETALKQLDQVIRISPLDPYFHCVRGVLALDFDDKHAIATQAFAVQRRLLPIRVNLPMEQARAWMLQSPQQVLTLWSDALRRAAAEDARVPNCPVGIANTYQTMLQSVGTNETLVAGVLKIAGGNPGLLVQWACAVPASSLDREMPRILPTLAKPNDRNALFRVWKDRGSKGDAENFARSHPELDLSSP